MILDKIRPCLWKLELGILTYDLISLLSLKKWSKSSFWAPDPKVKEFFEIWWFYWNQLMILHKMRPCMWKLVLGFKSDDLIHLLAPSGLNVDSRPHTPNWRNFFIFHDFIESNLRFWIKWGLACENWCSGSGIMVSYAFQAQVAQM